MSSAGTSRARGGLDTVKFKYGWLAQAERLAAECFGADVCRFSVGGSTHGNQTFALAAARPGDEVVVSRMLHRSMLLGLVLAGLTPVWVHPDVDLSTGLPRGIPPGAVRSALEDHPAAAAVFLVEPSYVGTFSDIEEHARIAHEAGVPLIIDAAWAAHFGFHPDLPPHALGAGADAMVTSAHKVLPAYTQAALVLARTERLDGARIERAFEATHTTSPAGAILASTDAARALMQHHGERLVSRMLDIVSQARERLIKVDGLRVLAGPGVDPAKLVVALAGTGAHGVEIEADLIDAGLPVEMADRDTIVALVTVADRPKDVERFTAELTASVGRRRGVPRALHAAAGWIVEPQRSCRRGRRSSGAPRGCPSTTSWVASARSSWLSIPPVYRCSPPVQLVTTEALRTLADARSDGVRIAYAADPDSGDFAGARRRCLTLDREAVTSDEVQPHWKPDGQLVRRRALRWRVVPALTLASSWTGQSCSGRGRRAPQSSRSPRGRSRGNRRSRPTRPPR